MPSPAFGSSLASQRLLLTGGRGRLARLIADELGSRTGGVCLFSRHGGDGLDSLEALLSPQTLAGGGVLLHLAWSCLPAVAEQQPGLTESEDLPLLRRLLAAVQAAPAATRPHFVFFSSGGAVYGDAPGRPNVETDECHPIGAYGRGKCAAERLIAGWARATGCRHTILRISNPYGYPVPEDRPQGIIPHAIRAARTGQPLTLWGDGTARKDFLHYRDFLAALAAVVAVRPEGTFNLSRGESHDLNEVLAEVERQTGRRIERRHTPAAPWDVHDSRLANDRLRAATGWRPTVSLAEGIRRSVGEKVRGVEGTRV